MTSEPLYDYDMIVIGSGPAGQRAAIQAAKLEKKVAVVEKRAVVGGVSINSGTIPSKTLREAVMFLSGYNQHGLYGASYTVKDKITVDDLMFRTDAVVRTEIDVVRHQLMRNGVDLIGAEAEFIDAHTLRLTYLDGRGQRDATTGVVVIATGTTVARDGRVPFDGKDIFTSDDILHLNQIPRSMTVVGGGVIGVEYATIFAALGVRVTVIDKRERLLPFVDYEVIDELTHQMRDNRITLRLGEEVSGVEKIANAHGDERVRINLASGKQIVTQKALYCIGRMGAISSLNLEAAGLSGDDRGRIPVDSHYCTTVPNIYAVGDVIGFPSLASTSMEQGRLAACHAFGIETRSMPELFPYGIYTIPEISIVGRSEEELTQAGIPYEIGKASYREIARGQIIGDHNGMLKLIFHLQTRELLGVHIIGTGASELIHIGQSVLAFNGQVDYFVNTVFNYPTLAECYKTAAFDGLNRLG
jgi:NAD(P) transhydrogenase